MEDNKFACSRCGSVSATFIKDDLDFKFDTLRYRCDGCGWPIIYKKREGWEERELLNEAAGLYNGVNTSSPVAVNSKLDELLRRQLILERELVAIEAARKYLLSLRFFRSG